jgi:hypothetical protein
MVAIVSRTSRKALSAGSWLANMSAGSVKPDHPGAQERVVGIFPERTAFICLVGALLACCRR